MHNLLPCTLHATLTQQGEWRGGSPTAPSVSRLYAWQRGERASDGSRVLPMGAVKTSERGVMFVVRSAAGDVGKYIVAERTAKFPSMGKVRSPCVSQRPPSHAPCVAGCQPMPHVQVRCAPAQHVLQAGIACIHGLVLCTRG